MLIIGAGGVAHVAAHKAAMHNDLLGDICIASRTLSKCEAIIDSVTAQWVTSRTRRKRLHARQLDALDVAATAALIRETGREIVVNLGSAFVNMSVLDACIETGAAYIDTAIHEDPDKVCEDPPWYANYEWQQTRALCRGAASPRCSAPASTPASSTRTAALAAKKYFDTIDTIDILDVNAGSHGRYFATNFDPEINFREFVKVWTWIDRAWQEFPTHAVKRTFEFPVVGEQPVYLNGHDELHSLSEEHRRQQHPVLDGLRRPLHQRVHGAAHARPAVARAGDARRRRRGRCRCRWSRRVLPDPQSLAPGYTGKTCIGNVVKGTKDGKPRELFIYQVSDHAAAYAEVESQGISYTAGVPPVAAAMLIADGRGTRSGWSTSRSSTPSRSSRCSTRSACRPSTSRSSPARRVLRGRRARRRAGRGDRHRHRLRRRPDDRRPRPRPDKPRH